MREQTQWDSGANLVCVSPGVVFACDRNVFANKRLRKARMEVITIAGCERVPDRSRSARRLMPEPEPRGRREHAFIAHRATVCASIPAPILGHGGMRPGDDGQPAGAGAAHGPG
ncbi:arginine deiminase family protein [Novosphingobium sp. ZW T3_23]|uniref:arginine deiminase family protein n=1 Tax=Novosphingobium sp. ZW T3_23 TaxID=3378084 RepID=UPI003855577C